MMTPRQAFRLEKAQQVAGMSDGQLLALAREVAMDGSLATLTLLSASQVDVLIERVHEVAPRELDAIAAE